VRIRASVRRTAPRLEPRARGRPPDEKLWSDPWGAAATDHPCRCRVGWDPAPTRSRGRAVDHARAQAAATTRGLRCGGVGWPFRRLASIGT